MNIGKTQHLDLLPSPIIVLVLLIVIRFFHRPRWIWARPPPTSTSTTAPSGGCLRRYPTQTHTICSTHWSTYPKIHSRKGIDGVSCQLKISTPITTPMKVRFHRMSGAAPDAPRPSPAPSPMAPLSSAGRSSGVGTGRSHGGWHSTRTDEPRQGEGSGRCWRLGPGSEASLSSTSPRSKTRRRRKPPSTLR